MYSKLKNIQIKNLFILISLILLTQINGNAQTVNEDRRINFEIILSIDRDLPDCSSIVEHIGDLILCQFPVSLNRRLVSEIQLSAEFDRFLQVLNFRDFIAMGTDGEIMRAGSQYIPDNIQLMISDIIRDEMDLPNDEKTIRRIRSVANVDFTIDEAMSIGEITVQYNFDHNNNSFSAFLDALLEGNDSNEVQEAKRRNKFVRNLAVMELQRRQYSYNLVSLKVFYKDPDDKMSEVRIPGNIAHQRLTSICSVNDTYTTCPTNVTEIDTLSTFWSSHFANLSNANLSILRRGEIDITSFDNFYVVEETFNRPSIVLGLESVALHTTIYDQKFDFEIQVGQPEINYPFVWGGGVSFNVTWVPDRELPLFGNLSGITLSTNSYDNFSQKFIRDTERKWTNAFMGGDVFNFERYPDQPRRLMVNRFELSLKTNDLSTRNGNDNFKVFANIGYDLPFNLNRKEAMTTPVQLKSTENTINPQYRVFGFDDVEPGSYFFTRSQFNIGVDVQFINEYTGFIGNINTYGVFYLRNVGLNLYIAEQHIDNVYVESSALYLENPEYRGNTMFYGETTRNVMFVPEATIAFRRIGRNFDSMSLGLRGVVGGVNNSLQVMNDFQLSNRLSWQSRLVLYQDFAYNAIFITGPKFRLDLK